MNKEDLRINLWTFGAAASMSKDCYAFLSAFFWVLDRIVKIAVAVVAIWSLVRTAGGADTLALSILAVVIASILNIVPLDYFERKFSNLRQRWDELHRDATLLELDAFGQSLNYRYVIQTRGRLTGESVKVEHVRRYDELVNRKAMIDEPYVPLWIVRIFRKRENIRRWGAGIDSGDKVKARIKELVAVRDTEMPSEVSAT